MPECPNIVLITADSLRSDFCGFYDTVEMDTTPFLSELTETGVVFTDAVSPGPRTPSSMPTIFTGERYVPSGRDDERWRDRIARIGNHVTQYRTIAQRLKNRGYTTAAVTANPWTTAETNFDGGFDYFVEAGSTSNPFAELPAGISEPARYLYQWWHKSGWFTQWTGYQSAIERVTDALEEPYFLWVFSLDSHNPYLIPRQFREETNLFKMYYSVIRGNSALTSGGANSHLQSGVSDHIQDWLQATYRDAVRSVDRLVEWIWNQLEQSDPVVMFHSDHGEAFGEHGQFGHRPALYEENISVPFLVGNVEPSGTVDEQVPLRRLPEILVQLAEDRRLDMDGFGDAPEYLFTESGRTEAVRDGQWKLIRTDGELELYNLARDPGERDDVVDGNSATVRTLRDKMESSRTTVIRREQVAKSLKQLVDQGTAIPDIREI